MNLTITLKVGAPRPAVGSPVTSGGETKVRGRVSAVTALPSGETQVTVEVDEASNVDELFFYFREDDR